ncbi:unnamed protein product [Dictyota dichotoma]
MEVIDISKFYRFESIPNPLIIASDIIQFNEKSKNIDQYIKIDNCKQWFNGSNTKKTFHKFDEIIRNYFKFCRDSDANLSEDFNIKQILNNKNIYLIIKRIKIDQDNSSFILLPINNFENLSNTAVNRMYLHRDGLFEINPNPSRDLTLEEKPTINRRFYCLNDLLTTQGVSDSELDIKTKYLKIETEDDIQKRKGLTNKILGDDPKFYSTINYESLDYLPEIDPEPEYGGIDDKDSIWLQKYGIPRQDYEYNEAEMDNTLFNNPTKYCRESSKEVFPIFENINDVENFLLTIFEDLLEPLKKKKISITKQNFFELTRKEQYTLLLPTSYILNIENSEILDPSKFKKLIDYDKFEGHNSIKSIVFGREKSNKQTIDFAKNYTANNFDQNSFITISNSFLLEQSINIGIVKIGLGDFLSLWFSPVISQKETFLRLPGQFLNYIKVSKSTNFKGNLLFIPKLINNNQNILEQNIFKKFKSIKDFNIKKSENIKFKFVYQLGKVMDLYDVNSLLSADLKL